MNIYELHKILQAHEEFTFSEARNEFTAIWKTGKFDLFDYDAGILAIHFYPHIPTNTGSHSMGFVSISTIDDGGCHIVPVDRSLFTKEMCKNICDKLHNEYYGVLPTQEELQKFFDQFGEFEFEYG